MKEKVKLALIAILLLSTALFFGLWQMEKGDLSDVLALAQAGAADAHQQFQEFRDTGEESCYWYGVAAFRSFEQAYHRMVEGTNEAPNYTFCNEVYGQLVLDPQRSQAHMDEIIEVMAIWAEDVTDPNGPARMADLRNDIQE